MVQSAKLCVAFMCGLLIAGMFSKKGDDFLELRERIGSKYKVTWLSWSGTEAPGRYYVVFGSWDKDDWYLMEPRSSLWDAAVLVMTLEEAGKVNTEQIAPHIERRGASILAGRRDLIEKLLE